jgi:hypothetical protein
MQDDTEQYRRARSVELNSEGFQLTKEMENELAVIRELEARYGTVWDTQGLRQDFEVIGFLAPYVIVRRKSDGAKGSLEFIHSPRAYFNWQAD